MADPTEEQRTLLNAIWEAYRREGQWPSYLGIDQVLDRQGLQVRPLVETMPPGLMIPDRQRMSHFWFPRDNDELRVQIGGLAYCDDTADDLVLVMRLVRYLADRERRYVMPSLSKPQPLQVSSEEAKRDLGLSEDEVARSWSLLRTFASRVLGSGGGGPEHWSFEIDSQNVRRYRDVETVAEYLVARGEEDRPQLAPFPPLPSLHVSPAVFEKPVEVEAAREGRSLWSTAVARLLRHPVVATIVGGLVLAAIFWAIHSA